MSPTPRRIASLPTMLRPATTTRPVLTRSYSYNYPNSSDIQSNFSIPPSENEPIHILGAGLVGILLGFSLRSLRNPPPVTFLTHRQGTVQSFDEVGRVVELKRGKIRRTVGGFDIECTRQPGNPLAKYWEGNVAMKGEVDDRMGGTAGFLQKEVPMMDKPPGPPREKEPVELEEEMEGQTENGEDLARLIDKAKRDAQARSAASAQNAALGYRRASPQQVGDPIKHLIIAVKAHQTAPAIAGILHRITPETEILLVQNGMGLLEEIMETFWPGGEGAPKFSYGVVTHGLLGVSSEPFRAIQSGFGNLQIGEIPVPGSKEAENPFWMKNAQGSDIPEAERAQKGAGMETPPRYLTNILLQCPDLDTISLSYADLLIAQLEKLATNAVINPLSVLLNVRNGAIFTNQHGIRCAKLLMYETSFILRSLPELRGLAGKNQLFHAERLYMRARLVAQKTAANYSSMWQDVLLKGRSSEIDYMNGFLVKRAMEGDIPCSLNYLMVEMIRARTAACRSAIDREVPFRSEFGWNRRMENEKEGEALKALTQDMEGF